MAKHLGATVHGSHEDNSDLALARSVAGGSVKAWHAFLHTYSGLIHGVVGRFLFTSDDDEVESVYVDILKNLYDGDIANFRGESNLAAWIVVYSRNRVFDYIRKRRGRCRGPSGLERLSRFDRDVFRYYYIDRLPLRAVVHILSLRNGAVDVQSIVESIQRIESSISNRYLRGLEYQRKASQHGFDSASMLKFLVYLRCEYEEKVNKNRPDAHMLDEEARRLAGRLSELLENLPPEEREIVHLRFMKNMTAPEIADRMDFGSRRRVYTVIDRVLRKLRRGFDIEEL